MKKFFYVFTLLLIVFLFECNKPSDTKRGQGNSENVENATPDKDKSSDGQKQNSATEIYAKKQVPVLCYHRIENGRNDEYTVTPAGFDAQMKILADSGYHSINPDQLYDYLVFNKELPEKPVLITFDDSRVEHATIAAPVMEKYGLRGVFFIMTITYNKKNYMTTEQIAALAKAGHTIGLHSWDHTRATKYDNDSILRVNIVEPRKKLEEIVGQPVNYFAYPYGLTNDMAMKRMNDFFKISFILSTKQDSVYPLQTVRRMIVPMGWSPQGMLRSMHKTFNRE